MSKEKVATSNMWFAELFQVGVYKRSQGKIARQVTFAAMAVAFAMAAYRLYTTFGASGLPVIGKYLPAGATYGASAVLFVVGLWISYRVVNMPRFADFLIAVEAEMNKVSWPSRGELIRSSAVVIFVIFFLSITLFGFDVFWGFLFEKIGILRSSS
jgi:preprotein translocase subunit SecE